MKVALTVLAFHFQLALDNIVRKLERGGEAEESAPSFFNLTVLN